MNNQIQKNITLTLTILSLITIGTFASACSTEVKKEDNTNANKTKSVVDENKTEPTQTPEKKEEENKPVEPKEETPKDPTLKQEKLKGVDKVDDRAKVEKKDDGVSNLKKGQSYAEARKVLIAAGWKPVKGSDGEKFGNEKRMIEELKYTEVESCSGTGVGYCLFAFKNAEGKSLTITTVNNDSTQKGGPKVNDWSVS